MDKKHNVHVPIRLTRAREVDKTEIVVILKAIYAELHEPLMRLTNNSKVNTCAHCGNLCSKEVNCINADFANLEDADYDLKKLIAELER